MSKARWQHLDCAAKRIMDPVMTADLREDFETEVQMLTMIRHPRVLRRAFFIFRIGIPWSAS